jgi:quercetin dioxygenase-like cupin family protein
VNVTYTGILANRSAKASVEALQAAMLELPQYEPPTEHVFHGGMYCRQVKIPAGCTIVGKKHKQDHLFMIVSGEVCIVDDGQTQTLVAPAVLKSKIGVKRAIHAVTDTVFLTVHATEAVDVEQAEELLVEPDESSPFTLGNKLKNIELEVSL